MKTIQIQLSVTLDEGSVKSLAELLAPAIMQAVGLLASETEQKKDARLKVSRNAIFGGEKPPEDQSLLLDNKQAAKLLKISERTLWELSHTNRIPPPVRIGAAVRWSFDVLKKWVEAGCPANPDC
jgi:predicted DNA-binding transcriptional regulator AlpA